MVKATIWQHSGFRNDKEKVVCKECQMDVKYCGNTTNLGNHVLRHRQDLMSKPSTWPQQMNLKQTLQLPANSVCFLTNTNLVELVMPLEVIYEIARNTTVLQVCHSPSFQVFLESGQ